MMWLVVVSSVVLPCIARTPCGHTGSCESDQQKGTIGGQHRAMDLLQQQHVHHQTSVNDASDGKALLTHKLHQVSGAASRVESTVDLGLTSWKHGYMSDTASKECVGVVGLDESTGAPIYSQVMREQAVGCWDTDTEVNKHGAVWLNHLKHQKPFSSIRYCDGEWIAMAGCAAQAAQNNSVECSSCTVVSLDGLPCNEEMLMSLVKGVSVEYKDVTAPNAAWPSMYMFGGYQSMWVIEAKISQWQIKHWFQQDDTIHSLIRGQPAMLEAVTHTMSQNNPIIFVGPRPLRRLCKKIPYERYLQIPYTHTDGDQVGSTIEQVKVQLATFFEQVEEGQFDVAGKQRRIGAAMVSMSLMSKKVILDLFPKTKEKHFLFELGSGFDPLIDDPDINGHRRLPWGDPAKWQPMYQKPTADTITELRGLVDGYASKSDEQLTTILSEWIQGPDTPSDECTHDSATNVVYINMPDPRQ